MWHCLLCVCSSQSAIIACSCSCRTCRSYNEAQVADLENRILELTNQIKALESSRGEVGKTPVSPIIMGSQFVACTEVLREVGAVCSACSELH